MRPVRALLIVCLTIASLAGAMAQDCKVSAPVRFSLGTGAGSRATVAKDTRHGRFVTRAQRRSDPSIAIRFSLDGQPMTPRRLANAPRGARACLPRIVQERSQAGGKKKLVCYVLGSPWCDEAHHVCYAIACCGSTCAAASAAY